MSSILVDAGPMIAMFEPADSSHVACLATYDAISDEIITTAPVLAEAFHILRHNTIGAQNLMDFVLNSGLVIYPLRRSILEISFELMIRYANVPMDFADATLVAVAEERDLRTIFTLDRDFGIYQIRSGHGSAPFEMIP